MNLTEERYSRFALVREMMESVAVARRFDPAIASDLAPIVAAAGRLFLGGEGSSRLFPAKNAIRKSRAWGAPLAVVTEASRQAAQYDLSGFAAILASNSGRTKEVIHLARRLRDAGNRDVFGLTANPGTVLEESVTRAFVLSCGAEQAVAATKSVLEQALFYQALIAAVAGRPLLPDQDGLAEKIETALTMPIPAEMVTRAQQAPILYFAGYNDGVAEELALKTNEITRKKSDYLEGTYAVHGVEEVMDRGEIVFVIDPIEEEMAKFEEVLVRGVGLTVVAIADRETPFPTIVVPSAGEMTPYVHLAAGWNLLVEIGVASGIDLDKPQRARKVGNEIAA
jgi:glucosamine--fructose-6-phosphate aminotransferase (isomerizing)